MSNIVQIEDSRSVRRASVGRKLNKAEAMELTSQIRQTAGSLWQLVAEAHDRKAWAALGYDSWKDYASLELQMSESRSYQIIDTGRVMRAIAEVAGDPRVLESLPAVTARETAKIKPHLTTFKREIAAALKAEMPIEEAIAEAIYSLPNAEKRERQPRIPNRIIEGQVVEVSEREQIIAQAQAELLAELEAQQAKGKKRGGVAVPMFSATEPVPTPRGKKVCPTCDGHGFV